MNLNLEDNNVFKANLTVDNVREMLDDISMEDENLLGALDEAQGHVHSGKGDVAFIVLEIRK